MGDSSKNVIFPLKLDKICRTCLLQGKMESIFSNCFSNIIIDILNNYTSVKMLENVNLPSQICSNCVEEVNRIYKFKKLCESSENTLNKYIQSLEENIKIVEKQIHIDVNKEKGHNCISLIEDNFDINSDNSEEVSFELNTNKTEKQESCSKYECKMCNIIFETQKKLLLHRRHVTHLNNKLVTCKICSKSITGGQLNSHMKLHENQKRHSCNICERKFSSNYNLRRHLLVHSGERPYQCEECNKSFTRAIYLRKHCKVHCNETSNLCSFCGKCFTEDSAFHAHLKVHDTKNNKCEMCGMGFENADLLLKHLQTHQMEGSLLCKLCGKRFMAIRRFKMHMKFHADKNGDDHPDDKTYTNICKTCQRSFQTRTALNNHTLIHGDKSFLCNICGKGFINLSQLEAHMRTHSGSRPFSCKQCSKSFAQYSGLNTHALIHSGLKPYACTICDKSFTQSHHRKVHMLTHSGERPFTCQICGKSFAQKGNYVVHVRIHTGETPFECSVCSKGFYDSSSMNKHKRIHHK